MGNGLADFDQRRPDPCVWKCARDLGRGDEVSRLKRWVVSNGAGTGPRIGLQKGAPPDARIGAHRLRRRGAVGGAAAQPMTMVC